MKFLRFFLLLVFVFFSSYTNANSSLFSTFPKMINLAPENNIFQMSEATEAQISIQTHDGTGYTIIWENDLENPATSSNIQSHQYENSYSGSVKIIINCLNIKKITLGGGFAFDIQQLYAFAPRLESLTIDAGSHCYGNLASKPTSLTYIDTETGNFHGDFNKDRLKNVERLRVVQGNTISFDVSDFDSTILYIGVTGNNTASGYIDSLNYPNLSHFDVKGQNTITGDLGMIQMPLPRIFVLAGNNTVSQYTANNLSFSTTPKIFIFTGTGDSFSTASIDALLIDLNDATTSWNAPGYLFLTGTHQAPSNISAAAREDLTEKGATISTN